MHNARILLTDKIECAGQTLASRTLFFVSLYMMDRWMDACSGIAADCLLCPYTITMFSNATSQTNDMQKQTKYTQQSFCFIDFNQRYTRMAHAIVVCTDCLNHTQLHICVAVYLTTVAECVLVQYQPRTQIMIFQMEFH